MNKDLKLSQKKMGYSLIFFLFIYFFTDRTSRNVGQQNSLVGVKLHTGLTLQASSRWCFNNKYLGKAPLNWITLV